MWEAIKTFFSTIGSAMAPFVYGLAFAFLMCPVYNRLKKRLHKYLCSAICLALMLAIFAFLILLIVPQLVGSATSLIKRAPEFVASFDAMTNRLLAKNPELFNTVKTYYSGIGDSVNFWFENSFIPNISSYFTVVSSGVMSVVAAFKNIIIGLIIMVYFLNMKGTAKCRAKKICYSVLSLSKANTFIDDCRYAYNCFNGFLVGKIIDSVLIGLLTFIVVSIFRIPYAAFVSIVVGITNVIPFFGPFIGAIPCALIILVDSPIKCLEFVIIIIIIQQLDGNVIGPKILGNKVGVSSFWVLFSILLFGGIFGFAGMVLGVPTFAVIYRLVKRWVYERLWAKNLSTHTKDYKDLEKINEETKEYITKDDTGTT